MINNRYYNRVVAVAVICALIITFLLVNYSKGEPESGGISQEYEGALFGTDVISLEITVDGAQWDEMLENATDEKYIMVDVVINGKEFQKVGIRPKGNSSLSQVAKDETSDRFSFRIKFDAYIEGQSYFGLDTFVLNNMLGDNSYMKEYLSYDIMKVIGVDTPLYNFSNITVNGEAWGFYLAIEAYDNSFLNRVYGDTSGNLYNVKSMEVGNMGDIPDMPDMRNLKEGEQLPNRPMEGQMPQDGNAPGNFMPGGMGGRGTSGGDLKYTDENSSSYTAIFDNAIGSTNEEDHERVIAALENLSTGTDLETYFDVDQILRYMAAHTVVVNLDSYSSSMAQNYYIYENEGKMTILPWDYNFSFGGFQAGSASAVVNFPIDTPVSGVTLEERPLFNQLLANPDYMEKYHEYLNEIMTKYFTDGKWAEKVAELDELISNYVENDPTAFCTFDAYKKALSALTLLGELRAESILGQLKGTVPATTTGQSEDPKALIEAGQLTLSDLGSGIGGRQPDQSNSPKRPKKD